MIKKDLFNNLYNPDVLSCLANLSSDEVFTSPDIANKMLDMLPQDLFKNKNAKFLDIGCKTGVFLREIAKRLILGLEDQIPDLQKRVDHIFKKQIYGIAITELTSLLSRRGLYCSKQANSKYSITHFNNQDGNIRFKPTQHTWKDGKCIYCGASKENYDRDKTLETHAYEIIHTEKPEEIWNMKFDVIISNPPYQLDTAGAQAQATPIYDKFIETAIKLNPKFISMIVPSRWFTGGFGLKDFRAKMAADKRIRIMHDYYDASQCFSGVEIKGGVNYFLWDRDNPGKCKFYSHYSDGTVESCDRYLQEDFMPGMVFRDWRSIQIVNKIYKQTKHFFTEIVGPQTPFGISTNDSNMHSSKKPEDVKIYAQKQQLFIRKGLIQKNANLINEWKLITPKAVGSGNISTDRIKPIISEPGSCCSGTYIYIGPFANKDEAESAKSYIETKFFHFLVGQLKITQDCLFKVFSLVPLVKFDIKYTDNILYKMFNLSKQDIEYIEKLIWVEGK